MHGTKGEMVPVFVLSNVILGVTEGTQGGKKISLFQLSQMYIAGEIHIKLIYLRGKFVKQVKVSFFHTGKGKFFSHRQR